MIDTTDNIILINGRIKTSEIAFCEYDNQSHRYNIVFIGNPKTYSYSHEKVICLKNPTLLNHKPYSISHNGRTLSKIKSIWEFSDSGIICWRIRFANGSEYEYNKKELVIKCSCLEGEKSKNVFEYLKEVAAENALSTDDGTKLLSKQYAKISFIPEDRAIAAYLNPDQYPLKTNPAVPLIFPFGCNASQLKAVQAAFCNQISVIQGPPGTGKTQTILNIIANILVAGKTAIIVSNNNSATANVHEKLSKYGMGFLVAPLGNSDNKLKFTETQLQEKCYPDDLNLWQTPEADLPQYFESIHRQTEELGDVFAKQERMALARQELQALDLEWLHYVREITISKTKMEPRRHMESSQIMLLWQQCLRFTDNEGLKATPLRIIEKCKWFLFTLRCHRKFRVCKNFHKQDLSVIISAFQALFYETRYAELQNEIEVLERELANKDAQKLLLNLTDKSMALLKHKLYRCYGNKQQKPIFPLTSLKTRWRDFLKEYPIVLSTTFSARTSLYEQAEFDYLIMDEASQVSVETGVLALSCTHNAIIVGDSMQLPNVVTDKGRQTLDLIARKYDIPAGYDCASNSFLESLCRIIPDIPQTLLREHYRCHPKIINFCNQKFYGGDLICMTEDRGESDVLSVIKTVEGNHSRGHVNQREIDVIKSEVLPNLPYEAADIGIIAPYNNQVNAVKHSLGDEIDIATVHKFQGREKEVVIMTTVDDIITSFSDDPNLLNVAISRAKQKFCLVVSGNPQPDNCNLSDLISYIGYNNFLVTQSRIHSIFDYLYIQYTEARIAYLKKHKRISAYDSENLTYALLNEIIEENPYMRCLGVICHQPLNILIRDLSLLNADERKYAANSNTHIDFLIYNRVSKRPVLAVETDGYAYHRIGTRQSERDRMKDHILDLYKIPLVRLSTTGSGEKELIETKLYKLLRIS